jgi:IS30 family transposase
MRSKLTPAAAGEVERLVAEGLALDVIGSRLGVHRRTILRWVERDADFRQRYERARRFAHELLYDELREVIVRPAVTRREIYAARRSIMRRAPKKYGCLPPELRPRLLY